MAREMISQGNGWFEMTEAHKRNNDLKTAFVDALFKNDWETMTTMVHADFELREPKALPYGGTYKGIEGFKHCWDLIPASGHKTEYLTTLGTYFTEDPDFITVELETRGRSHKGEPYASKVMEQFEFKDGLISAIVLYWFDIP